MTGRAIMFQELFCFFLLDVSGAMVFMLAVSRYCIHHRDMLW